MLLLLRSGGTGAVATGWRRLLLLLVSLATNGLPTEEDLNSFGGMSVKSVGGTNLAEKNECTSTLCLKLFQALPLPPLSV